MQIIRCTLFALLISLLGCGTKEPKPIVYPKSTNPVCEGYFSPSQTTHECVRFRFDQHLWSEIPPLTGEVVNVVVEIPAYTKGKWAVDPESGRIFHEMMDGVPLVGMYALPYLVNYGMIPQTLAEKKKGWDGDPLDAILLGNAATYQGEVIQAKPIGVMHMIDGGEKDDKIILVPHNDGKLSHFSEFDELLKVHRGLDTILRTWFENYKFPKLKEATISVTGFSNAESARKLIAELTLEKKKE